MKKLIYIFGLFISAECSFAEPFSPTVLKLTVPDEISYKFDGTSLTIPVTVTGTPAVFYLVINTKGQAENIIGVKNGFLGWHYVNKIDTTIYVSPRFEREIGETEIIWDGIDENGNPAKAGAYDYYLWGYDNKSNRKLVSNFFKPGDWFWQHSQILENGEDGLPLARPLFVGNLPWIQSLDSYHASGKKRSFEEYGVHFKWEIGNDPLDQSLLHTTRCLMYQKMYNIGGYQWPYYYYYCPVFDLHDFNVFYHCCKNDNAGVSTMLKWQFVTGGEAILDENWLGWNEMTWNESGKMLGNDHSCGLGCFTDGNYIYLSSTTDDSIGEHNILRCVSFDGDVVFEKMMHSWYIHSPVNGKWVEENYNGMLMNLYSRENNKWFLSGPFCCLLQMIDTSRLLVNPDDETDMVVFENRNGDYFLDVGYQDDLKNGWFCNDYLESGKRLWMTGATRSGICIDSNNFNIVFTGYYYRAEEHSFAVMTQDGTGIDNMAFGDETPFVSIGAGYKFGGLIVDSGSGYDGFYINRVNNDDTVTSIGKDWRTFYVAFDSCHGIITSTPTSVEQDNPLQFSVEQNSPNPFNPSTVICFTIPENCLVTVDIYNIAGQKIQKLVNDVMKAGLHSITWNAEKYPSGVYFYKVKSGKFEKTMKMTLIK